MLVKIGVIGTGYVGLVTGACFAELGHLVTCVDVLDDKITKLKSGVLPFYEPDLEDLVIRNTRSGNLQFTTSYSESVPGSDLVFVCVGTPANADGSVDTSLIWQSLESLTPFLTPGTAVVIKSTVPVGTCATAQVWLRERTGFPVNVFSNPEFLRQGSAVRDMFHPDRVVLGASDIADLEVMVRLYSPFEAPIIKTSLETAELIKYASNAFLATKISFINELARFCDAVDADVTTVAFGMGLDKRIGKEFLRAGVGYGGSCFPKDTAGLINQAAKAGTRFTILERVDAVNREQWRIAVKKLSSVLGSLERKRVAVLGISFKPDTDDTREAPSLKIIRELCAQGARVVACDPVVSSVPGHSDVTVYHDPYEACRGAHAAVLITEWGMFRELDLAKLRKVMESPVLIDGRNLFDPGEARKAGFTYRSIGRGREA